MAPALKVGSDQTDQADDRNKELSNDAPYAELLSSNSIQSELRLAPPCLMLRCV